jgi:hypothetical protein
MHEPRARVEAEAKEADLPRRRFELDRVMVRHGDVEGGRLHVLRVRRPADGAVVRAAAIGGADDQRLAEPLAERLQLVERGGVQFQLAISAAPPSRIGIRGSSSETLNCRSNGASTGSVQRRFTLPRLHLVEPGGVGGRCEVRVLFVARV